MVIAAELSVTCVNALTAQKLLEEYINTSAKMAADIAALSAKVLNSQGERVEFNIRIGAHPTEVWDAFTLSLNIWKIQRFTLLQRAIEKAIRTPLDSWSMNIYVLHRWYTHQVIQVM